LRQPLLTLIHVNKPAKSDVVNGRCRSWYLDRRGNPALWPWSFDRFRKEMSLPDLADFDLAA
jgi:hypothetical protein